MVPRVSVLRSRLTARRALQYAAKLRFPRDTSPAERDHRVEEVIAEAGLTTHAYARLDRLGGIWRKQADLAHELLIKPSIVFLDEPTAGLHPHLEETVMAWLRDLAHDGRTVIVVAHGLTGLDKCDRLVVLVHGTVAFYGPPAEGLSYFATRHWVDVFEAFARYPDRDWAAGFAASAAYARYVAGLLPGLPGSPGARPAAAVAADRDRAVPSAGDTVWTSAGEPVEVGAWAGQAGQDRVYEAVPHGDRVAVRWCPPAVRAVPAPGESPSALSRQAAAKVIEIGRQLDRAWLWPADVVTSAEKGGFGYVVPVPGPRLEPVARLLTAPEQVVGLRTRARMGVNLTSAFASLHVLGLCHRDPSLAKVLADPETGEVAVLGFDDIGPSGLDVPVTADARFLAPAVVRGQAISAESDLHWLAVLLFYLFCLGHPLQGAAVDAAFNEAVPEPDVLARHFGTRPVFVFDPADTSNRPVPDSPVTRWWPIYPQFFRDLFTAAFTAGLADPVRGRPAERTWREGLQRLADAAWECASCRAAIFFDRQDPERTCWNCGTVPGPPLVLTINGHQVIMTPGAIVTGRHLGLPSGDTQQVAAAETDPRHPGALLLRNLSADTWTADPDGAEPKAVKPQQQVLIRPRTMRIAGHQATIGQPDPAAGR
jgi:hypothetical protein